jgi:hypothetical protein
MDFTKEELLFTYQIVNHIQFKIGQSNLLLTAESIVKKLEQEAEKHEVDLTQLLK